MTTLRTAVVQHCGKARICGAFVAPWPSHSAMPHDLSRRRWNLPGARPAWGGGAAESL
eukprot:CAMPEP_0174363958 /NCGR_PEP_ID=MMETSP0811_2-20130205/70948_1 /TAXON_ID=73025 ORGANISM="Eutreptiella gymnastica-like, Strain CCMP1594" /NCGR_SAMPLE_ID=MMETSP0811_2 /ASSEMBLY_ACC=CAM_ASM_000667 /LENGTH=57 /DNA_ID=CAMNT_0015503133 /DNA_START=41 /DNA_END=214 /DNA_ORIENTATION=-